MGISIIIPILNEEPVLKEEQEYFKKLGQKAQLFFVDGGSSDGSMGVASQYGRVVSSRAGRGLQKNVGAACSQDDVLCFLHVDTKIEIESLEGVQKCCLAGCDVGCFRLKVDDSGWVFRFFEKFVNRRARKFSVMDGDLGMFISRRVFNCLGGFNQKLRYMEDIEFSRRLTNDLKVCVLESEIVVSSRKWTEKGFLITFWNYAVAYLQYWTGICFRKDIFIE